MRAALCLAALSLTMTACGYARNVSYTFTRANVNQTALSEHTEYLRKVDGVAFVAGKLDTANNAVIEIVLDKEDRKEGLEYLDTNGYQRVRN